VGVRPPGLVFLIERQEAFGVGPVPTQRALVPLDVSLVRIVAEDHNGVAMGTAMRFLRHGGLLLEEEVRAMQGISSGSGPSPRGGMRPPRYGAGQIVYAVGRARPGARSIIETFPRCDQNPG